MSMNNIYKDIVKYATMLAGSRANTDIGMARAILKYPNCFKQASNQMRSKKISIVLDRLSIGSEIELNSDTDYGYRFRGRNDLEAQRIANDILGNCGHRFNYHDGEPKTYGGKAQCQEKKIHYRGRFSGYQGSEAYRNYQSCVGISRTGKSAIVIVSCILRRRIISPMDLRFRIDKNGICIQRLTDKMDFHPHSSDWLRKDFWTHVRREMAKNYFRRIATKKIEKENKRFDAIRNKQMMSCFVTLEDSRRAGNCIEGSLQFAESRLGVTREEVIGGAYLFGVSGERLLRTNNERARAAVLQAWKRETTVNI